MLKSQAASKKLDDHSVDEENLEDEKENHNY